MTKLTLGDHPSMRGDLNRLQREYERLGAQVIRVQSASTDAVFHRDVAAWTPFGLIECRMGKLSRAWEPRAWFEALGLKPALTIYRGSFEGADLLWLNPRLAVLGKGQRTDESGLAQVARWLSSRGVRIMTARLPSWHDQHLLGVANSLAGILVSVCDLHGPEYVQLPDEYDTKGPNWVQIGDVAIVEASNLATQDFLREWGITSIPIKVDSLLAHGGGVACATGIIDP